MLSCWIGERGHIGVVSTTECIARVGDFVEIVVLRHRVDISCQHTLLRQSTTTPSQYTLLLHTILTPYNHTLYHTPINTPYNHTLPYTPVNISETLVGLDSVDDESKPERTHLHGQGDNDNDNDKTICPINIL